MHSDISWAGIKRLVTIQAKHSIFSSFSMNKNILFIKKKDHILDIPYPEQIGDFLVSHEY